MLINVINSDIRNVDFSKIDGYTIVWDQPFHYSNLWEYIPSPNNRLYLIVFSDSQRVEPAVNFPISKGWIFVKEFVTYQGGRFRGRDGILNGHKNVFLFKSKMADFVWTKPKYKGKELTSLTKIVKPNTKHKHYKDIEFVSSLLLGIRSGSVIDCFRGGGSIEKACELIDINCTTIDFKEKQNGEIK